MPMINDCATEVANPQLILQTPSWMARTAHCNMHRFGATCFCLRKRHSRCDRLMLNLVAAAEELSTGVSSAIDLTVLETDALLGPELQRVPPLFARGPPLFVRTLPCC